MGGVEDAEYDTNTNESRDLEYELKDCRFRGVWESERERYMKVRPPCALLQNNDRRARVLDHLLQA